VPALLLFVTLK